MKGLLTKDFLTLKKKYGIVRVIIDLAIIITLMIVLESAAPIYICFLLLPLEITSMIISLTTCDEEWRWDKFAISLPITKTSIVKSRYLLSGILSFIGLIISILVNTISYFCFPKYKYGFYLFIAFASFAVILLFLAFILPSTYSLGVNAGFAIMIVLLAILLVLGFWSKLTNNSVMWFVVDNFEFCTFIGFLSSIAIYILSYILSINFFKKKHI